MMVKVIHLHGNMMKHAGFLGFELEGGKWGYFKSKGYGFGLFWTLPKIAILRGFWNTAISHSLGSKAVRDRLVTGDLDLPFCNPRVHTTSA